MSNLSEECKEMAELLSKDELDVSRLLSKAAKALEAMGTGRRNRKIKELERRIAELEQG